MAKPYIYTIYITIPQPHWLENIDGICANYLTNNERVVITRTKMFIGDKNMHGVQIKVFDHRPSKNKKENEDNVIQFAKILLRGLYQETALLETPTRTFEVYNERRS